MNTLIIFTRAPLPGRVKTRLERDTPMNQAQTLALFTAFLRDTIAMSVMTSAQTVAVHFTPSGEADSLKKLVDSIPMTANDRERFVFSAQTGETFTDRISNSFKTAGEPGASAIVMIGSDAPLVTASIVDQAFRFINSQSGMVLGPSGEGGVYLIGIPASAPVDFSSVFTDGMEIENLLCQAKNLNMPLEILPETVDVDMRADLVSLVGIIRAMDYARKFSNRPFPIHTAGAIEKIGLTVRRGGAGTRDKLLGFDGNE